tara:strand:+ start:341 stop:649 length:309 start_codon:yes stop_codon:yes gene_type:complete
MQQNRNHLRLPSGYDVLSPRSHSRVLWHLMLPRSDGDLYALYRGTDFADAADAFAEFNLYQPWEVWGKLITEPQLSCILKEIDDLIEAEDAHISEVNDELST